MPIVLDYLFTNMKQIAGISAIGISVILLGLHGCSIYISTTAKDLKENRFIRLALFLSLSDAFMGLKFIYSGTLNLVNITDTSYLYQCMLIKQLIAGSVMASLLQTLIICLERLHATFPIKKKILEVLTGNIAVGLAFVLTHIYRMVLYGIGILSLKGPVPCDIKYTLTNTALFTHDVPVVIMVVMIIVFYCVTIHRIVEQQKKFGLQSKQLDALQLKKKKDSALRMRKNMATLGVILGVTLLSNVPRSIGGFYLYIAGESEAALTFLWIANNVLVLVNALLDPVIYVFRIKKYRELLKSKLCRCRN